MMLDVGCWMLGVVLNAECKRILCVNFANLVSFAI
jgi:hypothetical protein